jgi:transcriptional regulator with XRE-family HTH domain
MQREKQAKTKKTVRPRVNHEAIRERREKLQLTMREAAERAGMPSRQRWYQLEAGAIADPSATTLWLMARVLGCQMDDLMRDGPR